MTVAVNASRLRSLMESKGFDVTGLAQQTGVTRQTIHLLLRPDYQPLNRSLVSVAHALGVSPLALIVDRAGQEMWSNLEGLIAKAMDGDPRAFEVLPAQIAEFPRSGDLCRRLSSPLAHQLFMCAALILHEIDPTLLNLSPVVDYHQTRLVANNAFFFGSKYMSTERIVEMTPSIMKRCLVFGAFGHNDFERHLK